MRKLLLIFLYISFCVCASAQTDTIRCVKPARYGGAYTNNGRDWAHAKDNIQDAINDLHSYMEQYGLHSGSVYVAAGTYEPTEGVEGGTGGQLSTSFIIYDGIHVYGGFNPANPELTPAERSLSRADSTKMVNIGDVQPGDTTVLKWQMKYRSVLSGNHNHSSNARTTFTWDSIRNRYVTRFPGNSYHVVYFASNGFIDDPDHPGYADTLKYKASIDGFTIQEGNASGATDVRRGGRDHTSMGGGVYMVKNSVMENCIVQYCSAAMRGGGVFMDGGGEIIHSLIHECQSLGTGVTGGYGGGVCIDNNGDVRRSWITRNVARMGGGAAIVSYPENHPRGLEDHPRGGYYKQEDFDPYISASIISNNTSTTEGGGVYLNRGGMLNHVTVTRNENAGRNISYGRTRYGVSGGVYIYGAGQVYNSVIWGNKCDANNDIQYAATTSDVQIPSYIRLQRPFIGYTALNNLDITDFTGTVRFNAYSFETENNNPNRSGNFTLFMAPPDKAGAGISKVNLRAWYPYSKTSLEDKAVQLSADYSTQAFSVSSIANTDFFDRKYEPISTLGAEETGIENIEVASVMPVNSADGDGTKIPTLFVDPNRVFNDPSHTSGSSWDDPLDNISEAIQYFREHKPDGNFQILVKQGNVTCAGIGAYYIPGHTTESDIYLSSIRMLPNLRLYGGFPSTLTGTTTEGRNPKDYPTRISADIISGRYENNALHVVSFAAAQDAVLDGFQLYYGNARSTKTEPEGRGGGIVAANEYFPKEERVDITNNKVRNCVIANCSGQQGAAVYVGGGYEKNDGTVSASLELENCVINNDSSTTSIIYASGATINMNHCTIVGNVTTANGAIFQAINNGDVAGKIKVDNSAFHGNSKIPLPIINNITADDVPTLWLGNEVTGSNNIIDSLYNRSYDGFSKDFGFNSAYTLSYPSFTNPVRNVGVARNTADNTVYGGAADYTPLDMNPVVNRGSATGDHSTWGTDLTATVTRDYGGRPDVGALECHQESASNENGGQATYGSVIYVKDYNTYNSDGSVARTDNSIDGRDGTSWATAINGNGSYTYNRRTINGLQYAINNASAKSGKPEVWVSEGKYTNKSSDQINEQNYAYSMAEGVNVFGGFPKQGNPSMRERNPKAYVSILQPQEVDPTVLNDDLIANSRASVARVLVQPNDFTTETTWNGFTIRYGYLHSTYRQNIYGDISQINTASIGTSGGAGVYLMEKGVLENCELLSNTILVNPSSGSLRQTNQNGGGGYHQAGAGAYITTKVANGVGGTLKNCVVANNLLIHKLSKNGSTIESAWMYGAGVYQNKGVIYNTIIHDNRMLIVPNEGVIPNSSVNEALVGAGVFLESGDFYNNTIVHNYAESFVGTSRNLNTHIVIPGVYVNKKFTMYNSIISDNTSKYVKIGKNQMFDIPVCSFNITGRAANAKYSVNSNNVVVHYSYIDIKRDDEKNLCYHNDSIKNSNIYDTNIYLDNNRGEAHTPDYTSAQIYNDKTFRLVSGSPCVNHGLGDIDNITIPSVDAGYADRVQDCAIDIGAYEYNGAENITPRESTEDHYYYDNDGNRKVETRDVADYFVTQNGSGDASANSPQNAACATKLQRVLDAAGRYKYDHPETHVIVRLEALPTGMGYTPSRSAATNVTEETNPRSYSIIVPRGVELQGGWPLNGNFGMDANGNLSGRDPINNVTLLSGAYTSGVENVKVYHVVTFTDHIYDENGNMTDKLISEKVKSYTPSFTTPALTNDFYYSKLDGLYIEGGEATGMSQDDQRGAAAVLTGYSHISDCIVRNNTATGYGGAFYMMPSSIVEGSVLENNQAGYGGAIAVADIPADEKEPSSSWAFILNSTISGNNATTRGGGLWFESNARTMNCVYWANKSSEQNEISGVTSTTDVQDLLNCPVNFCAVTSQTLAGNGNINISPTNNDGVRWGKDTNLWATHQYDFFLPSRASVLSRNGVPYDVMHTMMSHLPGIDSVDIAGVSRMAYTAEDIKKVGKAYDGEALVEKNNYNMEIGARAINYGFRVTIDTKHPLWRLFVAHPENMKADLANALMESGDPIYSQQGSSFANPFLSLTDALNYVIDARKTEPDAINHRFEIYLGEGTYSPNVDMHGEHENVRTRTFTVPEMVTLMGGIDASDPKNRFGQDYNDSVTVYCNDTLSVGFVPASPNEIRLSRERYDLNQNSVVEPWEMRHSTILSGFSEGSDLTVKNVYHVITSIADTAIVGKLPYMYSDSLKTRTTNRHLESQVSRGKRAIILDGITITDGSATQYEGTSVRNHNFYFRGGGIFICGFPLYEYDQASSSIYAKDTIISDMRQGQRNVPLIAANMLFQNNQARQGGAIYSDGTMHVVSSSFVQNLALSPEEGDTDDREYVTFSGGGAIATNDTIIAINTIFANNEARDGGGELKIVQKKEDNKSPQPQAADPTGGKRANVTDEGKNANDIRAYGGVIWAGDSAAVRLVNCNSVRNKAKAFASLYNCKPNTTSDGKGHPHFGVNCIFWGNEVEADQDSSLINYGDSTIGALYFSAYQRGKGITPTVGDITKNYKSALLRDYNNVEDLDDILGHANHNVIISDDNDAVDGPNFTLPSNEAGIDGYMPSADWVPSRVNALTDAGWGSIKQDSTGVFKQEPNIDYPDSTKEYFVHGIYGWLSDFYRRELGFTLLPVADEKYMAYADERGDEGSTIMKRISSDPLGTVTEDYIDIGVYEYPHALLRIADSHEVDELWVSDTETTGNNTGETFDHPTSDLQRAIQTLLLSRNNHPKIIHIMEGTYAPIYEQDNGDIGFVVNTAPNNSNVSLPEIISSGRPYQATSLTILGGYSKEIEGLRDVNQYPTILKMNRRDFATDANTAHLFYVVDAEQWSTSGSRAGESSGESVKSSDVPKNSESHRRVMPIVLDGLTFTNTFANDQHRDLDGDGNSTPNDPNSKGTAGAAIYYSEQFVSASTSFSGNGDVEKSKTDHLWSTLGIPKLTIRNCKFENNGMSPKVPAVYIGKGGGETLIYNTLFNNNKGNPVVSMDTLKIVNCTFANNGGHIWVRGDNDVRKTSALYNSLIWRNDSANNYAQQYEGFSSTDSIQYNAVYKDVTNTEESANNHNVNLSDTNADPMGGPNFVKANPTPGVALDYRINPGMRTMDRANTTLYKKQIAIVVNGVKENVEESKEVRTILYPDTTWHYDLSWGARSYGKGLDRGAYECRFDQQRVLYVIPTKTTGTMNGTSWENAYGAGQLQTAVDAAAIYAYSHRDTETDKRPLSYVLVRGYNNRTSADNPLSMHDGVAVYGSIPENFLKSITQTRAENDDTLKAYLDSVIAARPGIAGGSTSRSRVLGIRTLDDNYSDGSLIDGFEVYSPATLTEAPVNITKPVVLSKLIIHDNKVAGSASPVINMEAGLMYNSLVYDNISSGGEPVMKLGKDAAVLNCTIVSDSAGMQALGGNGFVANSVTFGFDKGGLSGDVSRGGNLVTKDVNTVSGIPFAPYLTRGVNPYRMSSYVTAYPQYRYQLNESSKDIAGGETLGNILKVAPTADGNNPSPYKAINDASLSGWVNFDKDCDLLGNNRVLGTIDRGCFETWFIDHSRDITADRNTYPHEGSVVYIMDNANLSLGTDENGKIFTNDNPFRPAFLLVRPGASLYGNGNVIRLSYVAAENVVPQGQHQAIVCLPFRVRVGELLKTTVNTTTNQINAVHQNLDSVQIYNGERRAAWDYHFSQDYSKCWEEIRDTAAVLPANTGFLASLPEEDTKDGPLTLRMISLGDNDADYVYTEDENPKTITLTQHDNRTTNDGSAHFTKKEDMGWNIMGLPYLVSNYKLGKAKETTGSSGESSETDLTDYPMSLPHVIYSLNANGSFDPERSWDSEPELSTGQGVMTQTAVNGETETVTFALPVKNQSNNTEASPKPLITIGSEGGKAEDVLRLDVSQTAKTLQYNLGSDGVKWLPMNKDLTSIYAISASGTPMSLASATPVETEIPIVVGGNVTDSTVIAIADTAGFSNVSHVWLKDNNSGYVVDLKEAPMRVSGNNFTLRLGGMRPDGTKDNSAEGNVHIYVTGRTLHVDGLRSYDTVGVYTISGQLYKRGEAEDNSYTCELHPGVYVVRAGGKGQAVAVR